MITYARDSGEDVEITIETSIAGERRDDPTHWWAVVRIDGELSSEHGPFRMRHEAERRAKRYRDDDLAHERAGACEKRTSR